MKPDQINNLCAHILKISASFIQKISPANVILSLDEVNSVHADAVSNHHLIELLAQLNPHIFAHFCEALFQWLSNPENGLADHPFTLDSLTYFCRPSESLDNLFRQKLIKHQIRDGAIPIYTSLHKGGDFFSTLWATKILLNYNRDTFKNEIELALSYLIERKDFAARSTSQAGFLLFLLLKYGGSSFENEISDLLGLILPLAEAVDFSGGPVDIINNLYLLEDLVEYLHWKSDPEIMKLVELKLIDFFQLQETVMQPAVFEKWAGFRPQSPIFQMAIKAAVVAVKYLNIHVNHNLALDLNSYLYCDYRETRYKFNRSEQELEQYRQQYDGIKKEFQYYESTLEEMWRKSESDYSTSIFLMMPFKKDPKLDKLTAVIKKTCLKFGFKVFRVDDPFRNLKDQLWDNIVCNMLACKYGIAVYTSKKKPRSREDQLLFSDNPNVALEFGFMKSRGKQILVLKDKKVNLPADQRGFLWNDIDVKSPEKTVPKPLADWLKQWL